MFDRLAGAALVEACCASVRSLSGAGSEVELVEQLRVLEELKSAAAAAQARVGAQLRATVVARHAAAGVPGVQQGRGVAAQVALARRESPHRGGQHLGLATALVAEMPHTLAALDAGALSEWRATLLVRETACLTREHRGLVDRLICGDLARLDGLGDRALAAAARREAYRLDPHSVVERKRRAESERRVTLRPAPDAMAYLTGLLPMAQGVAAYAALCRDADSARANGDVAWPNRHSAPTGCDERTPDRRTRDQRTRDQVMADTFVERLTGQSLASDVPVAVQLVMTERALLAGDDEPAEVLGYGPVPAAVARELLRCPDVSEPTGHDPSGHDPTGDDPTGHDPTGHDPTGHDPTGPDPTGPDPTGPDPTGDDPTGHDPTADDVSGDVRQRATVWVRRLFTHPSSGELVAMESRAHVFPPAMRRFLVLRDRTCRTPWCDAPIRHADHALKVALGGASTAGNGQGLCEACNYAKEAPGWAAREHRDSRPGRHRVETFTPTGHVYQSRPPPQPGTTRPRSIRADDEPSHLERRFRARLRGPTAAA